MGKNIVILLDGTSNEILANRTNVLRLYGTLEKSERQLVYYDPGIGTLGPENSWLRFWRKAVEVWGLVTGWGLDQNVKEAYRFLVENYAAGANDDGNDGRDEIFVFGFSRGAYTARVLAGFIHAVGLLEPRNLNLLDYAYRAYKSIGENDADTFAEVRLYERVLAPDHPPVRLLGLFDTVASVVEQGRYGPRLRSHAFTRTNRSVKSVRHAVAIDEYRVMFQPQYWPQGGEYWGNPFNKTAAEPQDVREVWFAGSHGDVGGGYPEAESTLLKIPLHWMIEQTKPMGLHYRARAINEIVLGQNPAKSYVRLDPLAKPHPSMNWAWAILEFIPQVRTVEADGKRRKEIYVPFFKRRSIPEGSRLHRSVIDRAEAGMKSPNIPTTFVVEDP